MKLTKSIRDMKKTITSIIFLFIFGVGIYFIGVMSANRNSEPTITSTSISQQLVEIQKLSVLEYNYTKVGKFENSLTLNGWSIPLTKKSFLLTYSGKLQAGVNLQDAKVSINDHTIIISLPEVQILENTLDENSIEVYDESKNIFNPISVSDYTNFATKQKTEAEEEAIENGFLSEAATKAQSVIKSFLQLIPEVKEQYDIKIEFIKQ